MLDMTKLIKRNYELTLPNKVVINVNPPKMTLLKKMLKISSSLDDEMSDEDFNNLMEVLSKILSNNQEKRTISANELSDMLDLDMVFVLLEDFFEWVAEVQNSKN